jgi:hypothetical protein
LLIRRSTFSHGDGDEENEREREREAKNGNYLMSIMFSIKNFIIQFSPSEKERETAETRGGKELTASEGKLNRVRIIRVVTYFLGPSELILPCTRNSEPRSACRRIDTFWRIL